MQIPAAFATWKEFTFFSPGFYPGRAGEMEFSGFVKRKQRESK
jgi:hypothetical protein